jgi:predicted RNase H-like nuclease (RuvC/YqgF family)
MSALDLFASAMGAFLVIAVIALPYYLKRDIDLEEKLKQCQAQNRQLQASLKQTQQQLKKSKSENSKLKKELKNSIKFSLLGITTKKESFTIVIDMSGSMSSYTNIMVDTVSKILEPLKDHNKLQIIGYNGETSSPSFYYWNNNKKMLSMTKNNKTNALQYVKSLSSNFGGGTPTKPALEESLNYDGEAIILLTDGSPNTKASKIISHITQLNTNKKEIHTVAIGDYRSNKKLTEFLIQLATKNNGDFIGISK